jgi:ankyrin repeat protein
MMYGSTHMDSNAILHRALSYGLPQHIDEALYNGLTCLGTAAFYGCSTAVSYLLSHGADPDASDFDGITVLGRVLLCAPPMDYGFADYWMPRTVNRQGHCDVILQLLEAGAAPRLFLGQPQGESNRAIGDVMYAGNRGQFTDDEIWRLMRAFVLKRGSLNVVDNRGRTPLTWAVQKYCTDRLDFDPIRFLVRNGADIRDELVFSPYNTALLVAIQHDKPDLVRWLLKKGAYPDLSRNDRLDPLPYAVSCKNRILSTLLDHGVEVNHVSDLRYPIGDGEDTGHFRRTALVEAVSSDDLDSIPMLLEHGADPNLRDNEDRTALGETLTLPSFTNNHRLKIVRVLLQHGANPSLPYLFRQRHVLPLQAPVYCESWSAGDTDISDIESLDDVDVDPVESERQKIIDLLVEAGGTLLANNTSDKQHHHLQLAVTTSRGKMPTGFEGRRKDLQLISDLYDRQLRRAGCGPGDDTRDLAFDLRSVLNTIPISAWDSTVVARVLRTGVKVSKTVITEIALDLERREAYAAMDDEVSVWGKETDISQNDDSDEWSAN